MPYLSCSDTNTLSGQVCEAFSIGAATDGLAMIPAGVETPHPTHLAVAIAGPATTRVITVTARFQFQNNTSQGLDLELGDQVLRLGAERSLTLTLNILFRNPQPQPHACFIQN